MIGNLILDNMNASSSSSHTIHLKVHNMSFKENKILWLNIYIEKESYSSVIIPRVKWTKPETDHIAALFWTTKYSSGPTGNQLVFYPPSFARTTV